MVTDTQSRIDDGHDTYTLQYVIFYYRIFYWYENVPEKVTERSPLTHCEGMIPAARATMCWPSALACPGCYLTSPVASANSQAPSQPKTGPGVRFSYFHLVWSRSVRRPPVEEEAMGCHVLQHSAAKWMPMHAFAFRPARTQMPPSWGQWETSGYLGLRVWQTGRRSVKGSLGHGWSDLLRQTIRVKLDGSGLKLCGWALVLTAGVSSFLWPVYLTWGVIRACSRSNSGLAAAVVVVVLALAAVHRGL